jgi:hypothetical protein
LQPQDGVNAGVRAALGTNIQIGFEVVLPEDFLAAFALEPLAFGFDPTRAIFRLRLFFRTSGFPLEPGHKPTLR